MMKFDNKRMRNFSNIFRFACYGIIFNFLLWNHQQTTILHNNAHVDANHPAELHQFKKYPDNKVHGGQHGAHLGPVAPRRAPCWPHEPCYQGTFAGMESKISTMEEAATNRINTSPAGVMSKHVPTLIARFMGPTWGPPGADRTQVGPMWATWTLLSGKVNKVVCKERKPDQGSI